MSEILCPWEPANFLIFSSNVPTLHYYSHLPIIFISVVLAAFIFSRARRDLTVQILTVIIAFFAAYSFLDSLIWASNRSDLVLTLWTSQILLEVPIYALSFYLVYVFVHKQDLPFWAKVVGVALVAPLYVLAPTEHMLSGIDLAYCDAEEGFMAKYYTYIVEILLSFGIVAIAARAAFKEPSVETRRKIIYFALGVLIFLLALVSGNLIGSFTGNWDLAQFGLFGMPVFIGFLGFMLVRFSIFNVQLLATEALVFSLGFMLLSTLFIASFEVVRIVVGVTIVIFSIFGFLLVRSVRHIDHQRKKIAALATDLQKANQILRQSDQLKSEFVSIASHQLRSPLTAIKGYVSMMLEGTFGQVPEKQQEPLKRVYDSTESLVEIVQDFLDVSRIDQGRMNYEFETTDLKELVEEGVRDLEPNIQTTNLDFSFDVEDRLVSKVSADEHKLKQVIVNLIDNAVKYTKDGFVKVTLKNSADKKWITFAVADSGMGIDKETLPRLFERFSRAEDADEVNVAGTGLGLYIARNIIEEHQGQIWAESDGDGEGATFAFRLPVVGE